MAGDTTVVHVTHETTGKIGGIGAVLEGFFSSGSYLDRVKRSIIIGPLFTTEGSVIDRLGPDGEVLYSSIDGFVNTGYSSAFRKIENFYNVGIVYGRRSFSDKHTGAGSSPEVMLIDVSRMDKEPVNKFKKNLFEHFGIRSDLYEHLWEYEQYVRLAPAAIDALKAIGAVTDGTIVISHEFMGMPTALAAILEPSCNLKTIFYAHEVATMRHIIEEHPGHDTMFYNVIRQAHKQKLYVSDIFGDRTRSSSTPLWRHQDTATEYVPWGITWRKSCGFSLPNLKLRILILFTTAFLPAGRVFPTNSNRRKNFSFTAKPCWVTVPILYSLM